ncbi:MAG: helix-turn-helix domain-containing protein [Lentisphaerae bacterium]|nr:helix-turn-helix domain-containing protein [Lentisphaerota bacterium]
MFLHLKKRADRAIFFFENKGKHRAMNETFIFANALKEKLPLYFNLAGTTLSDPKYRITRNCSPYYVLEAIREGRGKLNVNGVEYEVNPGDCYLLPIYGQHIYASDPESPWVKHWFNFNGTLVSELLRSYHLAGRVIFPRVFMAEQFADAINYLSLQDMDQRQSVFAGIITRLLAEISDRCHTGNEDAVQVSPEAAVIREFLMQHIAAPSPSLAALARKIGRSEAQMLRIFHKEFGTSPIAYLLEKKLEQAQMMLLDTAFSIKEIAGKLGFEDEFYFSRIFRKKCGKSPREYRIMPKQ